MSSKSPFKDNNGLPFLSPQMNRIISINPILSPTTSPKRLNLSPKKDSMFPRDSITGLSPVRTPKGRAGLRSPARRSIQDLNNSAVKRAYRTKISAILAQEDADSSDDDFEDDDLAVADSIIRDSRRDSLEVLDQLDVDFEPNYGEDVAHELESGEEALDLLEYLEEEPKVPKKRGRKPLTEKPPKPSVPVDLLEESPKPKRKYFREGIWTIFNENEVPEIEPKKPKKGPKDLFSLAFEDNKDTVPVVSGIQELDKQKEDRTRYMKFKLFPLPRTNDDEEMSAEYKEKYLPNIQWETKRNHITADDRAFFFEGPQGYFDQFSNREKHSVDLLTLLGISLENKEFSEAVELMKHINRKAREKLVELHKQLYDQWSFELSQGFNLCFYGLGSKIDLLTDYVSNSLIMWMEDFYKFSAEETPKILVLNGYNPSFKLSQVLDEIIGILIPSEYGDHIKISKSTGERIPYVVRTLDSIRAKTGTAGQKYPLPKLILVVHCIDAEPIRDDRTQIQLALLANLPEVRLICSSEHVAVPLLWDPYKTEHFRFLYHNLTTYEPYVVETSYKDVLSLGKAKKAVSNRGVRFVLSALNDNSKRIYKILLQLQLESVKSSNPRSAQDTAKGSLRNGIEFKVLHQKCIEQFITANEINFRSMLGEFLEHSMCNMTKDEAGKEKLFIPFTIAEMNKVLKDSYKG